MAKILVIDDEESIRKYFHKLLMRLECDVMTAADADEGLAMAADPEVKLIISDYYLPGSVQKADLVRALRELRPEIPVMVITGYADMDTITECEALGVKDVLTKPFELSFVLTMVKQVLETPA
jgi:DNA-binding NtrC family response regulator